MTSRIILDPTIQHGQPVVRGTRVPVTRILGGLAGGMTTQQLVEEYDLQPKDIEAALDYAVDLMEHEKVFALNK